MPPKVEARPEGRTGLLTKLFYRTVTNNLCWYIEHVENTCIYLEPK